MAHTAHHDTAFAAPRSRGILARIGTFLDRYAARQCRSDQIDRLEAMSDAELAKLGVTREGIVHYVFRDKFYI